MIKTLKSDDGCLVAALRIRPSKPRLPKLRNSFTRKLTALISFARYDTITALSIISWLQMKPRDWNKRVCSLKFNLQMDQKTQRILISKSSRSKPFKLKHKKLKTRPSRIWYWLTTISLLLMLTIKHGLRPFHVRLIWSHRKIFSSQKAHLVPTCTDCQWKDIRLVRLRWFANTNLQKTLNLIETYLNLNFFLLTFI